MENTTKSSRKDNSQSKKTSQPSPTIGGQPENDKDARDAGAKSATSPEASKSAGKK